MCLIFGPVFKVVVRSTSMLRFFCLIFLTFLCCVVVEKACVFTVTLKLRHVRFVNFALWICKILAEESSLRFVLCPSALHRVI